MLFFHQLMQARLMGSLNTILSISPAVPKIISNTSWAWIYFNSVRPVKEFHRQCTECHALTAIPAAPKDILALYDTQET